MSEAANATLLVNALDRTGIVAALSDFVFRHGGNVVDSDQYSDADCGLFFTRLEWSLANFALDEAATRQALSELAARFEKMRWQLYYAPALPRLAIFCSTAPHCLYDLLQREALGELGGEIALVTANHRNLAEVAAHFDKPFFHLPVQAENKAAAEEKQLALLAEHKIDLAVFARYMQIVSADFISACAIPIINIHHSFLPAFAGARPYHQARARGVKLIGATAHYVTPALDAGPIIEQDTARVRHKDSAREMAVIGRDLERRVLGRAVVLHLARRVLVVENRTIVFD